MCIFTTKYCCNTNLYNFLLVKQSQHVNTLQLKFWLFVHYNNENLDGKMPGVYDENNTTMQKTGFIFFKQNLMAYFW